MLQFNELSITPDGKKLIIDTQVMDLPIFENVTIDKVILDNQDTWKPNGPSSEAAELYSKDYNTEFDELKEGTHKHIRLCINIEDSLNNMYFVYVIADISNAPETSNVPCALNKEIILGTAVNLYSLYNILLSSIKEIDNNCEDPMSLINNYLRQEVVNTSIKIGDYTTAIKYWKKFFLNKTQDYAKKPCGCSYKS